jgi:hypothetical protein
MGTYYTAGFAATTDFKVGQAVKYLMGKGHTVVVAYSQHNDRKREERRLLAEARQKGFRLLNDIAGYNYKTSDRQQVLQAIQSFCDTLLAELNNRIASLVAAPRAT